MKACISIILVLVVTSNVWCCSCSFKADLDYDFIALVEVCQTEPLFEDSTYSDFYKIEIDILELFKGPNLSYVLVWSGYPGYARGSCDTYLSTNSTYILRAKYEASKNDFVTGYCSHNITYQSPNGLRNWVDNNPDWQLEEYRLKYLQIEPWKFKGDTLIRKYPNGNIESIELFKNGKRHGVSKRYFPSGKIWSIQHFKEGLKDGVDRKFDFEGLESLIRNFKNGRKHGKWIWRYSKSRKITRVAIYVHNQIAYVENIDLKFPKERDITTYDFSSCTKEYKSWNHLGNLEHHDISHHNGDNEIKRFDFMGRMQSHTKWFAKEKMTVKLF